MIDLKELYWAAGFIEGEGSFSARDRKTTTHGRSVDLKVTQRNPEPLHRLKTLLGGTIYGPYKNRAMSYGRGIANPFFEWHLGGTKAAEVMMTIYCLMSAKRKQEIHNALMVWRTANLPNSQRPADVDRILKELMRPVPQ